MNQANSGRGLRLSPGERIAVAGSVAQSIHIEKLLAVISVGSSQAQAASSSTGSSGAGSRRQCRRAVGVEDLGRFVKHLLMEGGLDGDIDRGQSMRPVGMQDDGAWPQDRTRS